jgi:hypothetical protein
MVNDLTSKLPTYRTYRLVEGGTDTYRSYCTGNKNTASVGRGAVQLEKEQLHITVARTESGAGGQEQVPKIENGRKCMLKRMG